MSEAFHPRAATRVPLVIADRLPGLACPKLADLLRRWEAAWHGGACSRRHFPPDSLIELLPYLWLYDRIDGRWFCRLAGEEVRYQNGRQIHRQWLDDFLPGAAAQEVQDYFDAIADTPGLGHVRGPIWIAFEREILGERLCLPLWNDAPTDGPADGLIGATIPLSNGQTTEFWRRRVVVPIGRHVGDGASDA